jgi:hypothetical protein
LLAGIALYGALARAQEVQGTPQQSEIGQLREQVKIEG